MDINNLPLDSSKTEIINANENNLARVISWVPVIDSKAQYIITIVMILLGYSISQLDTLLNTIQNYWKGGHYLYTFVLGSFYTGSIISLSYSFVVLINVIIPKRKPASGKTSILYYNTIAKMPLSEFETEMSNIDSDKLISCLSDQTYNNAKVVNKKCDQLSASIKAFIIGIAFIVAYTIFYKILAKIIIQNS
jgi:hypothetical protein